MGIHIIKLFLLLKTGYLNRILYLLIKMLNDYYTTTHTQKSTHQFSHAYKLIHDYTYLCLCLIGYGLSNLAKKILNVHYLIKCSQKSTHIHMLVYTSFYHNYNYQLYIPHIIHVNLYYKHKHAQNTNIPTYVHAAYDPRYSSFQTILLVKLCYLDFKGTTCYPLFSPKQTAEFICIFLHLLEPDTQIFIPSNYPRCNPKSTKLTFLNG